MSDNTKLISVQNLTIRSGNTVLVKDINFDICRNDLLGIAGESGSGKTMFVRSLLNILPDGVDFTADKIDMFGEDCLKLPVRKWRRLVGSHISFIPQNTTFYLHPMLRIKDQICDCFLSYNRGNKKQAEDRAKDLLFQVGFDDPLRIMNAYAWELSGGMRQRVNIAMALMSSPDLLIADEPTTALDAAIGRQIMELFMDISDQTDIAIITISHDLSMLRAYSREIMVMYAGRMVEIGETETLFRNSAHPYTYALLNVIPSLGSKPERLSEIPGYVPDSGREMNECIFSARCPYFCNKCTGTVELHDLGDKHRCLCSMTGGVII